jgi:hypothetical protein
MRNSMLAGWPSADSCFTPPSSRVLALTGLVAGPKMHAEEEDFHA